jgi:hypothetical protein
MALQNMAFEISGEVGMPFPLAVTKINEALGFIYDAQQWSFQLKEDNWLTPGLLFPSGVPQSIGTITATKYSPTIVGDTLASAQWQAYVAAGTRPLLTQVQIRTMPYSLYNIIAFDGVNTFTLDRNWMEPDGSGLAYAVYQAYFPAPVADFKRFIEIRDTTMAAPLDYWSKTRVDLALEDPQRLIANIPSHVIPYEQDARPNSPTLGYMLYELWPHPWSSLPYTFSYERRGPLLNMPADTLPYPFTEEFVKWKAKERGYLWKATQKPQGDVKQAENLGVWQFLAGAAAAEYERVRHDIARRDEDFCMLWMRRFVRRAELGGWRGEPFATITGQLNVGW